MNINRKHSLAASILACFLGFQSCSTKDELDTLRVEGTNKTEAAKKDNSQERPFKGRLISSTTLVPDIAGGYAGSLGHAWYPGEGEGNLTNMGKFQIYFNQYISVLNPDGTIKVSGAPVNMFFQNQLPAGITLPNEVSFFIFDKHGNSIWAKAATGDFSYKMPTETRVEILIPAEIIGGTGRFAGAEGYFTISGYSDLIIKADGVTSQDVLRYDGVIIY